jgi:hypothetical protein
MDNYVPDDKLAKIPFSPELAQRLERLGFKKGETGDTYYFEVLLNAWEENETGLEIEISNWNTNQALAVGQDDDGKELFSFQGPPDYVISKLEPILPQLTQRQHQQHKKNQEKWKKEGEPLIGGGRSLPGDDNPRFRMREEAQDDSNQDLKQRLASLYKSMAKRLGIKTAPRVVFTQNQANASKPFGLTAFYNQMERSIKVYITGRHPTDILRSFAHELIHHWQNEHGALPPQNAGQAHYAQKDPVLRKREMEAYLLGNILFRDWQDENRYGAINESVDYSTRDEVHTAIRKTLFDLVKTNAENSFHEEVITKSELKKLIVERIGEAIKKTQTHGKYKPDYAQWQKMYSKKQHDQKMRALKYYHIGFPFKSEGKKDKDHYCWYWDEMRHDIVMKQGFSHGEHFGNEAYMHFRGRYDMKTKELSLTVPEYGAMNITGKLEDDVPPELLQALNKKFHHPKIEYFPFKV